MVVPLSQRLIKVAAVLALPILATGTLWWNQQHATSFDLLGLSPDPLKSEFAPRIEGEDIRFPDLYLGDDLPYLEDGAPDLPAPSTTEALMPLPVPGSTASRAIQRALPSGWSFRGASRRICTCQSCSLSTKATGSSKSQLG